MNSIFVCFMYSSGVPILLIFAGVAIIITFWVDKCARAATRIPRMRASDSPLPPARRYLLLRFYTRPPNMDMSLPRMVRSWLPAAALLHLSLAIWAYGNAATLSSNPVSTDLSAGLSRTGAPVDQVRHRAAAPTADTRPSPVSRRARALP